MIMMMTCSPPWSNWQPAGPHADARIQARNQPSDDGGVVFLKLWTPSRPLLSRLPFTAFPSLLPSPPLSFPPFSSLLPFPLPLPGVQPLNCG